MYSPSENASPIKTLPPMPPQSTSQTEQSSYGFHRVLTEELDRIGDPDIADDDPIVRAHKKQLLGLALSGGGIRSATFGLGVLQALAHLRLLSKFDYLSTVSGGGYIGSWLMGWIKRRGVKDVHRGLQPEWHVQPGNSEPEQIRFLRRFSNYLTPKLGWLGADMWTVIAVYIRNLILNLLVLAAAFAIVLLLPRFVGIGSTELLRHFSDRITRFPPITVFQVVRDFALATLTFAAWNIIWSLRYFIARKPGGTLPHVDLPALAKWVKQDGFSFYPAKLFDGDFILHFEFTVHQKGDCYVELWVPMKEKKIGKAAVSIRISDDGMIRETRDEKTAESAKTVEAPAGKSAGEKTEKSFVTGEIRADEATQAPACRAELDPRSNDLEIICSEGRCTVRVNKLTVNTLRVKRKRLRPILDWGTSLGIAVQDRAEVISFNSGEVKRLESAADTGSTQKQVQCNIILPLFLAAFAATFVFGLGDVTPETGPDSLLPSVRAAAGLDALPYVFGWGDAAIFAAKWCAIGVFAIRAALKFWTYLVAGWRGLRKLVLRKLFSRTARPPVTWEPENDPASWPRILLDTASIAAASAVGGIIVWAFYHLFAGKTAWELTVLGTPALIGAFVITVVLHIGFMGRQLGDERREWWSRINAWLLIYALAWIAMFGLALYTPLIAASTGKWIARVATFGWITSTLSGLIAARSAATRNGQSSGVTDLVAKVAPYIFVIGFFVFLAWAIDAILPLVGRLTIDRTGPDGLMFWDPLKWNWWWMNQVNTFTPLLWVAGISAGIALLLSVRLDINQFSMHMLYRNRLGRCYLGASNELRRAQPFTGFSPEDDFDLWDLTSLWEKRDAGPVPYPIINAALNLVGGKELAWQQRKAASFVFTPLYCGYDFPEQPPGYSSTKKFAGKPTAVSLATAMAISGAAASPNMGYHSSPAPAFLMTVFNVRLGWWLGNPRTKRWERSGPLNVLLSLLRELFGLTSETGSYIYLSDGGHFENLGIYELVRRRCRFIIASDAEEDHSFGFSGLGNAIEKCRSDFGVDIDIDAEPIRQRSEKGQSRWHCAIGRIRYSLVDREARDGVLVYLKSSLTGDEPTDVLRYAAANPGFPHQSTGDQWFDESQFESYRALGFHIVRDLFDGVGDADRVAALTKEELFVELAQNWYPPSAPTAESFSKHADAIIAIYNELRTNDDLQFLNRDIYPEWRILFSQATLKPEKPSLAFERPEVSRAQLPELPAELRAGFYICTAMCDIFEAVYVDLSLEQEFDHPDNRGWMNFFRHWSSAPMFRVTWTIGASNYGARFQSFCTRHLNLGIGCPSPVPLEPAELPPVLDPIPWAPEIGTIARKIVETLWAWAAELPSGSEVISRAEKTVEIELQKAGISPAAKPMEEARVMEDARRLVDEEFKRAEGKAFAKATSDSKDEIWYAAATLREFLRRAPSADKLKTDSSARVAQLALSHGKSIADRALSDAFQAQLNPIERELIELFLVFNPGLAGSAQIVRLAMTPEPKRAGLPARKDDITFPFAFAILADTQLPADKTKAPAAPATRKLVYFRVQDHLRRIGLARIGLRALLTQYPKIDIELQKMHPGADEIPTDKDYARLKRLYGSVKTEMRQETRA
jgi:hypothetical protein